MVRVCILGSGGEREDEGAKNFARRLARSMEDCASAAAFLPVERIADAAFWDRLRRFDPDVVHFVCGPRARDLAYLSLVGAVAGARTAVSVVQLRIHSAAEPFVSRIAPDVAFVQSSASRRALVDAGVPTEWLPGGVDVDRFEPVDEAEKTAIREDLGWPTDRTIFLHVGHFQAGRNVLSLRALREHGEVVVIGSPGTEQEPDVLDALHRAGCRVYDDYLPDIERYYQAADCYVFPTRSSAHCIEVPLSVLEAMACDLPVVTTPFGGLPDLFESEPGVRFVDDVGSISRAALPVGVPVGTRRAVVGYSWDTVARRALDRYRAVLAER